MKICASLSIGSSRRQEALTFSSRAPSEVRLRCNLMMTAEKPFIKFGVACFFYDSRYSRT